MGDYQVILGLLYSQFPTTKIKSCLEEYKKIFDNKIQNIKINLKHLNQFFNLSISIQNGSENFGNYLYSVSIDTLLCLDGHNVLFTSRLFYMGKKISKKVSAIRTISLAVGSLSLLVIAFSQVTGNEACTSNAYSIENLIRLS